MGVPATLGSFASILWRKWDDGDTPGQTGSLRREQQEQLERSHHREKTEPQEDETKHSPWKTNGGMPVGYLG
jgi:hypothetical protein